MKVTIENGSLIVALIDGQITPIAQVLIENLTPKRSREITKLLAAAPELLAALERIADTDSRAAAKSFLVLVFRWSGGHLLPHPCGPSEHHAENREGHALDANPFVPRR